MQASGESKVEMDFAPTPASEPRAGLIQRLIKQFSKFIIVGGVNTAIDIVVLRVLVEITDIVGGLGIVVLNAISFSVAVVNSYYMNKRWTFKESAAEINAKDTGVQFTQFFVVSVIGLSLNSIVVYVITTFTSPLFGLSPENWVVAAKLVATGVSLVWNFAGYKLFVFKK